VSQRRSRLERKAARVVAKEQEREVDTELGAARARRDVALHKASESYRKGIATLTTERAEARKTAHENYEQERTEILKRFATTEAIGSA
jgi:hypothetical protein